MVPSEEGAYQGYVVIK